MSGRKVSFKNSRLSMRRRIIKHVNMKGELLLPIFCFPLHIHFPALLPICGLGALICALSI